MDAHNIHQMMMTPGSRILKYPSHSNSRNIQTILTRSVDDDEKKSIKASVPIHQLPAAGMKSQSDHKDEDVNLLIARSSHNRIDRFINTYLLFNLTLLL